MPTRPDDLQVGGESGGQTRLILWKCALPQKQVTAGDLPNTHYMLAT